VSSAFRMSFKEFSAESARNSAGKSVEEVKHEVIVSFLALLELVKQGIIKAHQGEHFSDITLESDAVSTPTYE
jgi:chromatin segregation and condensation protein Rec8/ScpA/Scc1 (kleisin family)